MEQKNNELDIGYIFSVLHRNRWLIAIVATLFSLAVAIYAYFLTPIYTTNAMIMVENKSNFALRGLLEGQPLQKEDSLTNNIFILKSRKLVQRVLDRVDLRVKYLANYHYKNIERSNIPFRVQILDQKRKKGIYVELKLVPHGKKRYELFQLTDGDEKKLGTFSYGKKITTNVITFKIESKNTIKDDNTPYYIIKIDTDRLKLTQEILSNLTVNNVADNVIKLTYSDTLPNRAKKIVDEIAKVYIEYELELKNKENEKTLKFLDDRLKFMQKTLSGYGEKLKDFQSKHIEASTSESDNTILNNFTTKKEKLSALEQKLNAIKMAKNSSLNNPIDLISLQSSGVDTQQLSGWMDELEKKKEELSILQNQQGDLSVALTKDPELNILLQMLRTDEQKLKLLSKDFTSNHPRIIYLRNKISQTRGNINSYFSKHRSFLQQQISMLKQNIDSSISKIYQFMTKQKNQVQNDIAQTQKKLKQLPSVNMKLSDLKRNFTLTEKIYTFLLEKRMEIEVSKASTTANTKIVDEALVPQYPTKPNKKFLVASGFLVGLILGIALAFLKELLHNKIRNKEELESLTKLPIYGVIPIKRYKFAYKESFRALRVNIQYIIPKHPNCKIILVTSSIPKEGKTVTTHHLANILATASKSVVAIDLDMRKPRLHEEFRLDNKYGVSDVLVGRKNLDEVVKKINTHLDFMPSGQVVPDPPELLLSQSFENMINELAQKYEYIVFDTAPMGMVSDTNILMRYVDLALVLVRANYTDKAILKDIQELHDEKGHTTIGLILNCVEELSTRSGYGGYGYGYGYGYGEKEDKT